MKDNAPHLREMPTTVANMRKAVDRFLRTEALRLRDKEHGRVKPIAANFGALVRSMGQAAVLATKGASAAVQVEYELGKFRAECCNLGQDEERAVEEAKRLTQYTSMNALQAFAEVLDRIKRTGAF